MDRALEQRINLDEARGYERGVQAAMDALAMYRDDLYRERDRQIVPNVVLDAQYVAAEQAFFLVRALRKGAP